MRVRAVSDERDDSAALALRRQHGDTGQRAQARHCVRPQSFDARVDVGTASLVDELRCRRHAHSPPHIRRTAFKSLWQFGERGLCVANPLHHVAAVAQRYQCFKRIAPADQRTDAHRTVHLVAGEDHEIAVQR